MKKIISLFAFAIAMIASSCTNDDITISKTVNFTVDPSSIHGAFTFAEIHEGDLETFDSSHRLNVLLYIYDEDGYKVAEFSNTFTNYKVQLKESSYLPQGKYTAVAITHVTEPSTGFKYWEIEGSETLEGLRIKDLHYIGGDNKILGTAVESFTVGDNTVDLKINVQPAGAMVAVLYFNTDFFSNYGYHNLRLLINKTMDYLEFDRSGYSNVIELNNNHSFDWIFDSIDDDDLGNYYLIYNYEFILPMKNVGIGFRVDRDGDIYKFGEDGQIEFEKGASYCIILDTEDDDFYLDKLDEPLWQMLSSSKGSSVFPDLNALNAPLVTKNNKVLLNH